MVGAEGFELSTSSSQSWRSTRLSYTPLKEAVSKFYSAARVKLAAGKIRTSPG